MKPVVSSLVALAIALAPLAAVAKPSHPKTAHAKVVKKPAASSHADRAEDKGEKADKPIVQVKAEHGHKKSAKPAIHHAHNVDLGGPGHKEPKVSSGGAIVQASMKTPSASAAAPAAGHKAKPATKGEMPRLPNPNAGKPSKGGAEKGARKPAEKKNESDANDGEPARDEEFAELVARIRGIKTSEEGGAKDSAASETTPVTPSGKAKNAAHTHDKSPPARPCEKAPVEIVRGPEVERFELTKCDGTPAPLAVEQLSILIRPGGTARPVAPLAELAKKSGPELAHGIRRVDPRLVERIQSVAEHFGKPGVPAKLFVISGYRPASVGSMHSTGRAVDFRVEGARNEDVVAFCRTLGDTGCGFYPNSSFVHIDVRDAGSGHVTWIDASGPGETPRYVTAWPPPSSRTGKGHTGLDPASLREHDLAEEGAKLLRGSRPLDRESAPEPTDEHPAEVTPEH